MLRAQKTPHNLIIVNLCAHVNRENKKICNKISSKTGENHFFIKLV